MLLELLTYYLIAINFATFAAYGIDKARAENGQWRISEGTLLLMATVGGWPGAWAGRWAFRHKTRKQSFNEGLRVATIAPMGIATFAYFMVPTLFETEEARAERLAVEASVYYAGCNQVRAAGKAPLHRGEPGYRIGMDGDGDGTACEDYY